MYGNEYTPKHGSNVDIFIANFNRKSLEYKVLCVPIIMLKFMNINSNFIDNDYYNEVWKSNFVFPLKLRSRF